MLNVVALTGRLTADPELRQTQSGISVLSFSIAVNRAYAPAGEERTADFINLVAWRNTADFISKYFKKGNMIAIQGSIQTRSYEDKTGAKRTAFEVVVNNAFFTEGKSSNSTTSREPSQFQPSQDVMSFSTADDDEFIEITSDDDLPF